MTALGRPWDAIDAAYVSVLAAAHLGRLQEAAALIDELEPRAERIGNRSSQWALRGFRAALRPLTERLAGSDITVMVVAALPRAAAGLAAACAGAWDAAEVHLTTCLTLCDTTPIQVGQGTTREWYADMLMMRNAGDDAARAATLYAEAAEN